MKNEEKIKETISKAAKGIGDAATAAAGKTGELAAAAKEKIVDVVDVNGNGEIDLEDFIILGLRTPGIRVDRTRFLQMQLEKNHPQSVIDDAIGHNPAHAGIDPAEIERIANEVIKYERNCVSGISAALGAPGGAAMVATIPADMIQYYGYMLRATQKLMYLYGFPEIDATEREGVFDAETMNILTLCLGVMYGVQQANAALKAMAAALGSGVEKKLLAMALTKGTFYPMVKSVLKWFNVNLTKKVC